MQSISAVISLVMIIFRNTFSLTNLDAASKTRPPEAPVSPRPERKVTQSE